MLKTEDTSTICVLIIQVLEVSPLLESLAPVCTFLVENYLKFLFSPPLWPYLRAHWHYVIHTVPKHIWATQVWPLWVILFWAELSVNKDRALAWYETTGPNVSAPWAIFPPSRCNYLLLFFSPLFSRPLFFFYKGKHHMLQNGCNLARSKPQRAK